MASKDSNTQRRHFLLSHIFQFSLSLRRTRRLIVKSLRSLTPNSYLRSEFVGLREIVTTTCAQKKNNSSHLLFSAHYILLLSRESCSSRSFLTMKYTLTLLAFTLATFASAYPHPIARAGSSWDQINGIENKERSLASGSVIDKRDSTFEERGAGGNPNTGHQSMGQGNQQKQGMGSSGQKQDMGHHGPSQQMGSSQQKQQKGPM